MTNISVYGLWRDSEKYIDRSLTCLDSLLDLPNINFSFVFYENDSQDNTKNILNKWCDYDTNRSLISETLGFKKFGSVPNVERLILLSKYRNKFIDFFRQDNSDYSLLIDTDIVFTKENLTNLIETINNNNTVASIANTRQKDIPDLMFGKTTDSFYDVFCLRDRFFNNGLYFADCPLVLHDDRNNWENNIPIEISSGFSGFCLIKTKYLKHCMWSTCGHSEHVNFFAMLQKYGKILLSPSCKPHTDIDLSNISLDSCKNIANKQVEFIEQINQIYQISTTN